MFVLIKENKICAETLNVKLPCCFSLVVTKISVNKNKDLANKFVNFTFIFRLIGFVTQLMDPNISNSNSYFKKRSM